LARSRERRYVEDVHRLIPGIAVLLAYAIAPGAGELTENVAHFVLDGHAADRGPVEIGVAAYEVQTFQWFVASLEADGVLTGVFRPPIA
jgi:hypothetical protein